MKASIDREGCIGCGACVFSCPEVFRMAEDGLAEVYTDSAAPELEDAVLEAVDGCPVAVISAE